MSKAAGIANDTGDDLQAFEAQWFENIEDFALLAPADPDTIEAAMEGPESAEWAYGYNEELSSIEHFNTWKLTKCPKDTNINKSKVVLRTKQNKDGLVVRHKCHIVLGGYNQIFGVDYHETFAPTLQHETLRILLVMGASRNSIIEQADVRNAYLQAELKEELYMESTPLYEEFRTIPDHLQGKDVVVKLLRPLYGSKQGGNEWYKKLSKELVSEGFKICSADPTVFYKINGEAYTIIGASTDDFTMLCDNETCKDSFEL